MTEQMVFHQRIRLPYRYTAGAAQRAALTVWPTACCAGRGATSAISSWHRRGRSARSARPAWSSSSTCPTPARWRGGPCGPAPTAQRTFGLVQLDGADNALLHRIAAADDTLTVGLRVKARWQSERAGEITDVECFEPAGQPSS